MAKRGTSLKEKRSAKALRATRRAEAKAKGIAPKAVLPPPAKPNVPPTKPKPKPVPVVGADGLTLKQRIQKRNREKAQAEKATEAKKAKKAEKKGK